LEGAKASVAAEELRLGKSRGGSAGHDMENGQRHEIEDLAVGITVGMFVMQSGVAMTCINFFCCSSDL